MSGQTLETKEPLLFQAFQQVLRSSKFHLVYKTMPVLPRQEKPAADEASPAAVGKLLMEQIWTLYFNNSFFPAFLHSSRTKTLETMFNY